MFGEAFCPQPSLENTHGGVDSISITRTSYKGKDTLGYRVWTVLVKINNENGVERTLKDPFIESEYSDLAKPYAGLLCNECSQSYFTELVTQLHIENVAEQPHLQISIHEDIRAIADSDPGAASESSIYCLFWELLENTKFWQVPRPNRIRLCRTWTSHVKENGVVAQQVRQPSLRPAQRAEFRILLVVARSFRLSMDRAYQDYPPSLVLGPLLKIASYCNERGYLSNLRIDVVKPGTIDDLALELERRKDRLYDLVHLDMHGKIHIRPSRTNPSSKIATAYLRFGKHYKEGLRRFARNENPIIALMGDDDSLNDIEVGSVASLLQKYGITKVALSACLSSYAQRDMLANMCHIFLTHGVVDVSAMSFQVLESTAQIYYAAFYEALLVNGQSFLSAAAIGREALRAAPRQFANASVPTNYHRAARITKEDFWPPVHHVRGGGPLLFTAYGVRLSVIAGMLLFLTSYYRVSRYTFLLGQLGVFPLASMIWHGSVRYIRRLQCPRWLWMAYSVKIFRQDENLKLLNNLIGIEHLVLEDRLILEANKDENEGNGLIYLYSEVADSKLGSMVSDLAPVWVRTGFVDMAVVISAMAFISPMSDLQWWLRLRCVVHKSDVAHGGGLGLRPLVAINDFDRFHDYYKRQDFLGWEKALERMTKFAGRYRADPGKLDTEDSPLEYEIDEQTEDLRDREGTERAYLIVTGSLNSLNDDGWRRIKWPLLDDRVNEEDIIIRVIGQAVPHPHNVRAYY